MKRLPTLGLLVLIVSAGGFAYMTVAKDPDVQLFEPADVPEWPDGPAEDLAAPSGIDGSMDPASALDEDLQRTSLEESTGDASPLVVQVWAREEGRPAADAEVFFLELRTWSRSDGFAEHWSDMAVSKGRRFVADTTGRVELPAIARSAIIAARRPGEYGFLFLRRRHRAVESIVLARDVTVTIRVRDVRGQAVAGVPVALLQVTPGRRGDRERFREAVVRRQERLSAPGLTAEQRQRLEAELQRITAELAKRRAAAGAPQTHRLVRRKTDPGGLAVIRHVQIHRRRPEDWWPAAEREHFQAGLLVPAVQPVVREVHGLPEEPIDLTLPAFGSVAIRVVDHRGDPFVHPATAVLRLQGSDARWIQSAVRKEQGQSEILFPFVGVGAQVTPHVWLDDRDFSWDGPALAGPSRAGEQIEIAVSVPPEFGLLRGRVLDGAGRPMQGPLSMLIQSDRGRVEGEIVELDAQGRFQLAFKLGQHLAPFTLALRVRDARPPTGLVVPLSELVHGRTVDLGDLTLAELPTLATGKVVDDRGEPVAGAAVGVQRRVVVGSNERWRDEPYVGVRTDAAGSFTLYAERGAGDYRLLAQKQGHFRVEAPLRAESMELVLTRVAEIRGTLRVPPWLPARGLQVKVSSAAPGAKGRDAGVRDGKDGARPFALWNVRPGDYQVSVFVSGFPDPVLEMHGIRVEAGMHEPHPRLVDLDLSMRVFRYRFNALVTDGSKLGNPNGPLLAEIVRSDGRREFVGFPWNDAKAEVFSASPQLSIVQLAPGFRILRSTVAHGDHELRFERVPPIELTLSGLRALVGPELRVRISMVWEGETGLPESLSARDPRTGRRRSYSRAQLSRSGGAWLGPTDAVSVPLMREGRYQVVARLRDPGVKESVAVLGSVDVSFSTPRASLRVPEGEVRDKLAELEVRRQERIRKAAERKAAAEANRRSR